MTEPTMAFAPALVGGPRFLTLKHAKILNEITTFHGLAEVAIEILGTMREYLQLEGRPHQIAQLCGPISTGGTGNREVNLARLNAVFDRLKDGETLFFNQLVFEDQFRRIKSLYGPAISEVILPSFYAPIFASGHVTRLCFVSDWHTSQGATWERKIAQQYGMEIMDLED